MKSTTFDGELHGEAQFARLILSPTVILALVARRGRNDARTLVLKVIRAGRPPFDLRLTRAHVALLRVALEAFVRGLPAAGPRGTERKDHP